MDDIDWGDLDALKRERPALVLELMTAGDGPGFVRAVEAGFDVNVASDVGAEFFEQQAAAEYLRSLSS